MLHFQNPDPVYPTTSNDQHIYHHSDSEGVRINVKVEKNSRGYNYEATVTGAKTTAEAILLLAQTEKELEALYNPSDNAGKGETPKKE